MNMKDRLKKGFAVSIAVHLLAVVFLAVFSICYVSKAQSAVIEVAVFEPMGGHAGGGQHSKAPEEKQVAAPPKEPQAQKDELVDEALEQKEPQPQVQPNPTPTPSNTNNDNQAAASQGENSGSGEGTGTGDGRGYGQGQGEGEGTGDGSGNSNSPAVPPRILRHVEPDYPAAARNSGTQGTARIKILIDEEGRVETVDVVSSSGDASLDTAATAAIEQWRFEPAQNSYGQAMRCYTTIPITFALE